MLTPKMHAEDKTGPLAWQITYPQPAPLGGGCVLAIGNFDGVHAGHRSLLGMAEEQANRRGLPLVVLTFEPHPRSVLFPQTPLRRLSTPQQKAGLLAGAGAQGVAVLPFTAGVAGWSAGYFLDEVVTGWLKAACVCVGENFRFGHKASGDIKTLQADGRFAVQVATLLCDAGGVISSRRLREET